MTDLDVLTELKTEYDSLRDPDNKYDIPLEIKSDKNGRLYLYVHRAWPSEFYNVKKDIERLQRMIDGDRQHLTSKKEQETKWQNILAVRELIKTKLSEVEFELAFGNTYALKERLSRDERIVLDNWIEEDHYLSMVDEIPDEDDDDFYRYKSQDDSPGDGYTIIEGE